MSEIPYLAPVPTMGPRHLERKIMLVSCAPQAMAQSFSVFQTIIHQPLMANEDSGSAGSQIALREDSSPHKNEYSDDTKFSIFVFNSGLQLSRKLGRVSVAIET